MKRNNKMADNNKNKKRSSAKSDNLRAYGAMVVLAALIALTAVIMWKIGHISDNLPTMAENTDNTAPMVEIEEMKPATQAPMSEVAYTTTTTVTVSVTLEDVDTLPWATKVGKKYKVSKNDFVHLCNLVAREYGADFVPVSEKAKVAQTVMNRVCSKDFPNTVEAVITQPGQYEGELSRGYYSSRVTESVREAVLYCLNGNCNDTSCIFYWGDGYRNYFFNDYESFRDSYMEYLNPDR